MSGETIVLWSDGDWCFYADLSGYRWKSDDYEMIEESNPLYSKLINE